MDANRAIGLRNGIPWRLPEDLKLFKRLTLGHPVLMGRKTWESICRPLPGRQNIVLTRDTAYQAPGAEVIHSISELSHMELIDEEVMVIGGAQIYESLMPHMEHLYVSEVEGEHEADTYFPEFRELFPDRISLAAYEGFSLYFYSKEPMRDPFYGVKRENIERTFHHAPAPTKHPPIHPHA